ncbi:Lrp/AsnC family transcriptional regulator [uncultured Roseobacter sp.]|uniref:Lrp/AsnC family transcriptional regulator n=1 Tax=uncultured Roseobacter sp. TaxID=114847 RepID=UPI0026357AC3|nr:Lrp/AsnC family transcriptional regulator [uncultured Roseobacter sp.]
MTFAKPSNWKAKMDDMDKRLIGALRHNARASLSDLAASLGLTRATVRARLAKLQERGDILGFTVVMKEDRLSDPVRGLMMIAIEGRGTDRILRHLAGMPEVRRVYSTNGRWDVIVEIGTDTLERFDQILFQVRRLEGVTASETSLLLSTRKDS